MTRFNSLPIEVLDRIFLHLPQNSLIECQRVCQVWYSRAARQFLNQVIFRNSDEIKKFLNCQPRMTRAVKKLKVNKGTGYDKLSKENVQKLIMSVPNLQELVLDDDILPLQHLNEINLPTSLISINVIDFIFENIQDVHIYIEILTKLCDTVQKFNLIIESLHDQVFENWDMLTFFASFSKLIEIDVRNIHNINRLEDCLPIILAVPSLKSIAYFTENDIGIELCNSDQYKQRLYEFEKLRVDTPILITHTFSFITYNFVNLKEIIITISKSINFDSYYSLIPFLEFLDFMYSMDIYEFTFLTNHETYLDYFSNIVSDMFTQLPKNSQNLSRQLCINASYEPYPEHDIDHFFQLTSDRDHYNRLQRRIKWNFKYNILHRKEMFKCIASMDKINVDTFIFDISNTPFASYSFELFYEFLSKLIEPKRVVLRVSNASEWFKCRLTEQLDHISQLEIQVIVNGTLDNNDLSLCLDQWTNLKTMRLTYICSPTWFPKSINSFELPYLNLETLYLDVSVLVTHAKCFNSEFFILVIDTKTFLHAYEVSIDSLDATAIWGYDELVENVESPQFYITIQNLQHLYLQVLENYYELNLTTDDWSLLSTNIIKETLISL